MTAHVSNVYFQLTDLEVSHGKGSVVTTTNGVEYLDFTSGIAVTSTGHSHPHVVAAIQAQAEKFIHAQVNIFRHDQIGPLAERLTELTPPGIDTFFFTNSGAEATESALKLAKQATGRPNLIVFDGSFHGRTHMAMAMTMSKTVYRAGHAPLPSGVFCAPFPYTGRSGDAEADAVERALAGFDWLLTTQTAPSETAAVMMEPVLGEGGYVPAPAAFIQGIAERCKEHGILYIDDEVQSGFGRAGSMFAIDDLGVEPDIIVMAKGIASGFPMSAIGMRAELDAKWPTGSHGGTYGGNAIGCAAALATIDVLTADGFMANVNERGDQLRAGLETLAIDDPTLMTVRGPGLMVASEFRHDDRSPDAVRVAAIVAHCREESNLLIMSTGAEGTIVRWMPPLVVSEAEIDEGLAAFEKALIATR
ncbi:MAG: aminotransferase class III-fold pyridoxal phosphate-dependent enzyme [Acidimicrobiales bacterium]